MESLRELVKIVNKQVEKRINVMGNPSNYSSKMQELYEGIHYNRFKNDEEAAMALYQSSADNINYKKLKYRLRKRLINSSLFIDVNKPNFNEKQKASYTGLKNLAIIETLLNRGARKTAIDIAIRIYHDAEKHDHTDICLHTCKKLMRHYGTVGRDAKNFEKFAERARYYTELQRVEIEAEEYYERISFYYDKYGPNSELVREKIIEYTELVNQFPSHLDSSNLKVFSYYLNLLKHEIFEDLPQLSQLHDTAISYFESKRYPNERLIFLILVRQIATCIQLHQYEKGEQAAMKCFDLIKIRNHNWYAILESLSYLYLISGNYQKAYDLCCQALNEQQVFSKLHSSTQQKWFIKEAFIHFLVKAGKIDPSQSIYTARRFRIAKFLNEVPEFSSDKRWRNIPILIIQLLLLLQNKDYGTVMDKVEALNAYCYRYLRKDHTFRSNCFVKMLILLPKADFHKGRVVHRAKPLLKKLKEAPIQGKDISDGIEIIPYEKLWEFTIELLNNRIYSRKP